MTFKRFLILYAISIIYLVIAISIKGIFEVPHEIDTIVIGIIYITILTIAFRFKLKKDIIDEEN